MPALSSAPAGRPALHATLAHPQALTTTAAGEVLVGDLLRIYSIAG